MTHYSNLCLVFLRVVLTSIVLRVALTFEKISMYLCYWVQQENKFHYSILGFLCYKIDKYSTKRIVKIYHLYLNS